MNDRSRLDIQIDVESGNWPTEAEIDGFSQRVLERAAEFLSVECGQPFPDGPAELSLVFTDDAAIRDINRQWRGIDKPTNVLSFPAFPLVPGDVPGPMLGDIVLAEETLRREAGEQAIAFDAHLSHLLVHGFLHLFGYDHVTDEEATVMEALEARILAEFGLENPYRDDDQV